MEKTRKELILDQVRTYTLNAITDNSFKFDSCNANDIALDLKLDRSNVSRILNQLFNEFILIKVQGRPTLYLSKEIIGISLKSTNIPQVFQNEEGIKDFFIYNNVAEEPVSRKDLDIIGNDFNESLYSIISKLSPIVYFPQNYPAIITIQGEKGVGKKYFCSRLFELGMKYKKFSKKNTIYFAEYTDICDDFARIKKDIIANNVSMIVIEIFTNFDENKIYWFKNSIHNLYTSEGKPFPVIAFLVDAKVENYDYFSLITPYSVKYPNVRQRSPKEMIELVLSFLQEESKKLNCRIKVTSNTILSIICSNYPYNLYQLKNEINYLVFNKIYTATLGNNEPILLTNDIPKNIRTTNDFPPLFEEKIAQVISQIIPEIVGFYPDKGCEALDNLRNTRFPSSMIQKPEVRTLSDSARLDVLTSCTNLLADLEAKNPRLIMLITPLFSNSKLKNEKQIIGRLCKRIAAMITNTFNYNFLLEDLSYKETVQSSEISNNIIDIVEVRFSVLLNKMNRSYIRNYTYHALLSIKTDNIATLILCHGEHVAENYAQHLNMTSNCRNYYSFDYNQYYRSNDFQKYIRKLCEIVEQIDQGKGVLIIGDRKPLTLLEKPIVDATQILVFSLFPVSLPLLYDASELVNLKTMHLGSLLYEIISKKKEISKFLESDTYVQKNIRSNSQIISTLAQTFSNVNITKSCESLYQALATVCQRIKLEITNDLIIQFMFHGNFMIDRSIMKFPVKFDSIEEFKVENDELFSITKSSLLNMRDFISLQIDDTEIAILTELIINYRIASSK